MEDSKKLEIRKLIDSEHGKGFHKNINLSGYTLYRKESFLTFRFVEIKGKMIAIIEYIYITNKNDLIKLLSFAINFFVGKDVRYIYCKEHRRESNYVEKYLPLLEFTVNEYKNKKWKHKWKSSTRFKEEDTIEVYL